DSAVSQYDKDDVEAIGLVKFDFLGLATLTILELAKEFIVARRPALKDFAYENLPLDDPRVYKLFSDGLTEAVFQFESRGMQGMLRDAKPNRLEDLIALNAMFRPGPMDNIPAFCARKHGREAVQYPHPLLEQVLGETYGIMVYQEQVMQVAQLLAGYSLGEADVLRRAMGKKKPEEMAKQRAKFRAGCAAKAIDADQADEIFDLMEKFAGYGFNKSHAAAYALLAYQTAWLKVHFPAEFYAANMSVEIDDTDKLKALIDDARQFGVTFELPDVNRGGYGFEPIDAKCVRYGLGAVKGTGQGAIEAIIAARDSGGAYRSLFDFCARVDRQRVNKRAVEALIKAGAFDTLHAERAAGAGPSQAGHAPSGGRASLLASVTLAFDWADTQEINQSQGGLFDTGDSHAASTHEPPLAAAEPLGIRERLAFEKAVLGFYHSGHLFELYAAEVRRIAKRAIADVVESREPLLLAGVVSDLRLVNNQRGRVAIFKLDDMSERIEAVVNDDVLETARELLREDELLVVQGRVQPDRFAGGLRLNVQQAWDLAAARARFGRWLEVSVNGAVPPAQELIRQWPVRKVAGEHGSTTLGLPVRLRIERSEAQALLDLGDEGRFWPSDDALLRWKAMAHAGRAEIVYE
ncbi:MAG TPA: DNA polymerase III subunit alpha, partial [Burkholderiaceae bacterium]|nr:DNA polymerase III subunit alpha [Burkholderiaceae bacterium]